MGRHHELERDGIGKQVKAYLSSRCLVITHNATNGACAVRIRLFISYMIANIGMLIRHVLKSAASTSYS